MDQNTRDRLHQLQRLTGEPAEGGTRLAPSGRRRVTGLHLLLGVVAGLVVGAVGMGWLQHSNSTPALNLSANASTAAPAPSAPSDAATGALVAAGHVVARRQTTVGAELTGRIDAVLVREGQSVKAGQPLARLNSTLVDLDHAAARSRVESAQAVVGVIDADLLEARELLRRSEELMRAGFISSAELTRTELRVQGLQKQLLRAQADQRAAAIELERSAQVVRIHTIRAPFDGVVVEVTAQAGEVISPSSAGGAFTRTGVATIVDPQSLDIDVEIMEGQLARIMPGQRAAVRIDGAREVLAKVGSVLPRANRDRGTVRVRLAFVEPPGAGVLPDMAVQVVFNGS